VGITRALVKVGRDTRYETAAAVVSVLRRAVDELPGKLHLKRSRELAAPKVRVLRDFIASLEGETNELRHL
jgi:hypothetical protein